MYMYMNTHYPYFALHHGAAFELEGLGTIDGDSPRELASNQSELAKAGNLDEARHILTASSPRA